MGTSADKSRNLWGGSMKTFTLKQQGFRFVFRTGAFKWTHKNEMLAGDIDCTDMNDQEFEQFVQEQKA